MSAITWCMLYGVTVAYGQSNANDNVSDTTQAMAQFQSLTEGFKQLGEWEPQADIVRGVVDRVWRENSWEGESDQFAKHLVSEVSGIPPWNFTGRVGRMTELVGERYAFSDQQRQRLESSVYTEAGWMVVKNFGPMINLTREIIATRAGGRPFTPELVARWTRETEDLSADARERVERIAQSMAKTMTPDQRRLLEGDLESYRRREAYVDRMRERWIRGDWRPEDWGLEHDPIQAQWQPGIPASTSQPAGVTAAKPPKAPDFLPHDESTWARYVRLFIARYRLDDAQKEAAHSILREMEARARDYRASHKEEFGRMAPGEAATHSATEPFRRMFDELKARLDPIPTSAQRQASLDLAIPTN